MPCKCHRQIGTNDKNCSYCKQFAEEEQPKKKSLEKIDLPTWVIK